MATPVSNKIESTLKVMLNELMDECLACIKLINQLELDNLSEEQVDELLGELTASVTHLNTQSNNIKEEIEK
jgi:hypothetical protein